MEQQRFVRQSYFLGSRSTVAIAAASKVIARRPAIGFVGYRSIFAGLFRLIQSAVRNFEQMEKGRFLLWDRRRAADAHRDVVADQGGAVQDMQPFYFSRELPSQTLERLE